MAILEKLQVQLSFMRNLHLDSPMQGNITDIISNCLFLGVLFTYLISTSWYFMFNADKENYLKYFESRFYTFGGVAAIANYLENFRTRRS